MNFLSGKPLRVLALYLLASLSVIFVAEYLAIRYALFRLTESERKIDFARSVQVQNQQLALHVQMFIDGKKDLAAPLSSGVDHQDFLLKTLGEGGRITGTDQFLQPLTRLPQITFDNLKQSWLQYRSAIQDIIAPASPGNSNLSSLQDSTRDSSATARPMVVPEENETAFARARLIYESRWLSLSKWYDQLIDDLEAEASEKHAGVLNWFAVFLILNVALAVYIFMLFRNNVLIPLKLVEGNTSRSEFSENLKSDEIGKVASSVNQTLEELKDATSFVIAIGEGKLDLDYKSLNSNYTEGKNKLADSLIEMQDKLKSLSDEERKRQWVNEGLTKFVDILRSSNDDLTTLGDKIIAALSQYTNSNQGAIYILNDEDQNNKFLELLSLFAFDTKKYEQQKIKLGQGILGQTFLEKRTTYLTDLPESYIRITSGLGDAPPKSVLMVPLKIDTQVYGIVELASFHEYQQHEIGFVEKLAESIAATLASVKGTQKNRHLIEQFQQQTEEMRAQEEEMRQNMEELQATQEEIARKENGYIVRIQELEQQPGSETLRHELERVRGTIEIKDREFQLKVAELNKELAQKLEKSDDWQLAADVEKTLRINLEAIEITQKAMKDKMRDE
ncbi:MAG: GAF domain-containing protein [Chryseolinea sp.]